MLLAANKAVSFIGCQPTGDGFILDVEEAERLIEEEPGARAVIKPYLTGEDLADSPRQTPRRFVIDFGTMPLQEAARFDGPMRRVRALVRPGREGAKRHFARLWWQFAWPRPRMRTAIAGLDRYATSTLTGKRFLVGWSEAGWCPSNAVGVFAVDDDFSMGVLLSRAHVAWAWAQASTFKRDLRYTPSSVFLTFPWVGAFAGRDQREQVGEASRQLLARRSQICLDEQIGLTTLYNRVDEGAWADLKALHKELDEAVASCYGWPRSVAQDDVDIVRRLAELNQRITRGDLAYAPFLAHSL